MFTRRAVTAGALAAPAFLPHCARAQADTRSVLRVAVQALPPTLEPLETISNVGLRLTYNVFDALAAATEPAERKRLWLALLDEYETEAPALILYPVHEYFAKRRAVRWTHYPLYYMDFRSYNLAFA